MLDAVGNAENSSSTVAWNASSRIVTISSQATIYLARTRGHAWSSRPSRWLLAATAANFAAALTLALTGTLMAPLLPVLAAIAAAAIGLAALLADYLKVPIFDALGLHRV